MCHTAHCWGTRFPATPTIEGAYVEEKEEVRGGTKWLWKKNSLIPEQFHE